LYAQLPSIDCQGLCWRSCSIIDMTWRENQRIREHGVKIPKPTLEILTIAAMSDRTPLCPALTGDKRCAVYDVRPLICRLYGVVESMPCEHGCQPSPGYLTDAQTHELFTEAMIIGGHEVIGTMTAEQARAVAAETVRDFHPRKIMRGPFMNRR
jgi:Fe-S-cluster containining protein